MGEIILQNVSVRFPLYEGKKKYASAVKQGDNVGGVISHDEKGRFYVNALKDISLHIKPGQRVALIGHNGAGKSTLLRVMANIYKPDSGNVTVRGRMPTLLNTGAGMQMKMTGYENIHVCGVLRGMTEREVEKALPDIEEFTGLGHFLKMPVNRYSQGMRLRLAFAIATAMEPDILLIDEWMKVGDQDFQKKADQRLRGFVDKAHILVLASHNLQVIGQMCDIAVTLVKGRIQNIRPVKELMDPSARGWHPKQIA